MQKKGKNTSIQLLAVSCTIFSFCLQKENQVLLSQDSPGAAATGGQPPRVYSHISHPSLTHHRRQDGGLPVQSCRCQLQWMSHRRADQCCTPVRAAVRQCCLSDTTPEATLPELVPLPPPGLLPVTSGLWPRLQRSLCHRPCPRCSRSLLPGTLYSRPRQEL